jgi:Spy/CpxP family protein refolding chaperone
MHYGMVCGHRGARRRCCEEGGYGHPIRFAGWERHFSHFSGEGLGGAGFGVRRPLRFLAHKLQLNEAQVEELARVLNDLKTERAQSAVDDRRALTAFADSVAAAEFDEAKTREAATLRVKSAERVQDAVVRSLGRIHALLDPEQRSRLAYLIRTGVLMM